MTLPSKVLQFCPKCGSNKFVAQDEKSFKCDDCQFHFFVNSAAAVAAIIENSKGEVMLTVRAFAPNKGMLDLPGGFVDPNEGLEHALKRELHEELNLEVDSLKYIGSFPNQYVFSEYTVFTTDVGFHCQVSGWNKMHIQDDISDITFVSKETINWDSIASTSIKNIIRSYWGLPTE